MFFCTPPPLFWIWELYSAASTLVYFWHLAAITTSSGSTVYPSFTTLPLYFDFIHLLCTLLEYGLWSLKLGDKYFFTYNEQVQRKAKESFIINRIFLANMIFQINHQWKRFFVVKIGQFLSSWHRSTYKLNFFWICSLIGKNLSNFNPPTWNSTTIIAIVQLLNVTAQHFLKSHIFIIRNRFFYLYGDKVYKSNFKNSNLLNLFSKLMSKKLHPLSLILANISELKKIIW